MTVCIYACPVCHSPLQKQDRRWICEQNHSFDIHKKGYVNLLLAQNKRSKAPGDDSDMVLSRRRFLQAGHYQPLSEYLAREISVRVPNAGSVYDAGCGEGYYTQNIAQQNPDKQFYGLDISKPAITAASQEKSVEWCVASSAHPPYLPESFDAIVSVFSRVDSEPFYTTLKPNGWVCMVTPDHDHLMGLRHQIYETVRPYDTSKHTSYFDDRFECMDETRLEVPLMLNSQQTIFDLLGMTPHAHRLAAKTREQLQQLSSLNDQACFKIYWFKKSGKLEKGQAES